VIFDPTRKLAVFFQLRHGCKVSIRYFSILLPDDDHLCWRCHRQVIVYNDFPRRVKSTHPITKLAAETACAADPPRVKRDSHKRPIQSPIGQSPSKRYLRGPKVAARTEAAVGRAWHRLPGEVRCGGILEVIAASHSEEESCTSLIGAVTIKFGANCFLPFGVAGSQVIWRVPVALWGHASSNVLLDVTKAAEQ